MLKVRRLLGEWGCMHEDFITKCRDCNLVYCGKCHNPKIRVRFSKRTWQINCCPNCLGTSIDRISFGDPGERRKDDSLIGSTL